MKSKLYFGLIFLGLIFSVYEKTIAQAPDWLWAKSMGGSGSDGGYSTAVDPSGSGDVYTSGSFSGTVDFDPGAGTFNLTSSGFSDIFISKSDASGNFVWAKAIGGTKVDVAYSIAFDPTGSGGIYATGAFTGLADFDPGPGTFNLVTTGKAGSFVFKLDRDGNFLWAKAMSGAENGYANFIAVDPTGGGGVYTTGLFLATFDFDPGVGTFNLTSAGSADIFISKLDRDGNFLWAIILGGADYDVGYALAVDPSGSGEVYTTGSFRGTVDFDPGAGTFNLTEVGNQGIFISKLDRDGNFVWAKAMSGANNVYGRFIAIDPKGNGDVYTTGVFNGTVDFDPGIGTFDLTAQDYDSFISKLDRDGNFLWAKAIGGTGFDLGVSIAVDSKGSGDVYTAGYFVATTDFDPGTGIFNLTSAGDRDIFISKLDDSGNFVWAKAIGGTGGDYCNSIVLDDLGHVCMTGYFFSPSISFGSNILTSANNTPNSSDIFIAKLDIAMPSAVDDYKTQQISIYPNPVTDKLTIRFIEDKSFNVEITLYNIFGEVVFTSSEKSITLEKVIDISTLPNAIYFLELNINGHRVMKKIVKQER